MGGKGPGREEKGGKRRRERVPQHGDSPRGGGAVTRRVSPPSGRRVRALCKRAARWWLARRWASLSLGGCESLGLWPAAQPARAAAGGW